MGTERLMRKIVEVNGKEFVSGPNVSKQKAKHSAALGLFFNSLTFPSLLSTFLF